MKILTYKSIIEHDKISMKIILCETFFESKRDIPTDQRASYYSDIFWIFSLGVLETIQ